METNLSPALWQEIRSAFERISDLPTPVHASDRAGTFLFANEQAHEFFGIPAESNLSDFKIGSYYETPAERDSILRKLERTKPGTWRQNLSVRMKTHENIRKVRFVSKPFFDEQNQLAALLCITLNMSDFEWFAEFEETIVAGCFELDKQLKIVDCNHTFAEILHYKNAAELKGKSFSGLTWESGAAANFFADTAHPHPKEFQFKMRREDGAMAVVKMSWLPIADETGATARIKGTIRDITSEIIQDNLPVGLVMVTTNPEGMEIVSRANVIFADILGAHSLGEIVGKPIVDFHTNPAAYWDFRKALDKAAQKKQPLLDYFTEIKNKKGEKRNIVTNARYLPGEEQQMRVGAVYDVTNHEGRRKRLLEADLSAILHTFLATLNGLHGTLSALVKAQGHDILQDEANIDRAKAIAEANGRKKRLGTLLTEFSKIAEERGVSEERIARLQKFWLNLSAADTMTSKEKENVAWTRRNLIEIRRCLDDMKDISLPREIVKNIRSEVDELLRFGSMISLSISIEELNERITDFNNFRDYLHRGETVPQELKTQNLVSILTDDIAYLEEFAATNSVAIVRHFNSKDNIPVLCNKTTLNRAFHNLLHNAIKYSWRKSQDRQPWVDVRIEKRQDEIEITIENRGVAIRREELESGEIFQFGKRGKESDDRKRSGTGIGLYDAKDVIAKHNGTLRITSEPVSGNQPDIYTSPFITKAYVILPIAKEV